MRSRCFIHGYYKSYCYLYLRDIQILNMLFCLLDQLTKCLVRDVCSLQDFYKTNYIITCHQIRLHCSVLLYSVWIYFCSFHFCFPHIKLFLQCIHLFVRPSVFSERYQSVPQTPLKLLFCFFKKYHNFYQLRKIPRRGVTVGRQQKYMISPYNRG